MPKERLDNEVLPGVLSQFFLHLHPRKVPEDTLRFSLSLGLGGISLTLFVLLTLTGVMQLMSYEPTVQQAHLSIRLMYNQPYISGWLRNIHYWSSNLLMISLGLHLLRVLCTDALAGARRLNWVTGTLLLLLILLVSFTGYLLPWSQTSYWAVTIFINMADYIPLVGDQLAAIFRAGAVAGEIGQGTLSFFFVLHTTWLPLALMILLIQHFWLVRKAGGLVNSEQKRGRSLVATRPALIVREAAVGLATIAVVFMIAAFFDAPVGEPAMAGVSPNPVKAAWYFLGLQELLIHFHPLFAVFIFPLLTLAAFISLPFWQQRLQAPGVWFGGAIGRKLALAAVAAGCTVSATLVVFDALRIESFGDSGDNFTGPVSHGWLPLSLLIAGLLTCYFWLTRKKGYPKGEVILALWLAVIAWMVTLTITGIWFRGSGMALGWE